MTSPGPTDWERRPPLRFSDLAPGRELGPIPFETSSRLVERYVAITGNDDPLFRDAAAARAAGLAGPVLPPGLAGVWARQSYLGSHRMLPGGVMAGQDVELLAAALVGAPLRLAARVAAVDPADPRRRVVLHCTARDPAGVLVGRVSIDARWPPDEAP